LFINIYFFYPLVDLIHNTTLFLISFILTIPMLAIQLDLFIVSAELQTYFSAMYF